MNVSLTSHSIHTVCMRFGFSSSTARSSNKAITAARRSTYKTNHSEIFGLIQKNTSAPIHFINDECLWVPLLVGYHTVPFIERRDDELLFHQVSASTQIVADLLSPQAASFCLLPLTNAWLGEDTHEAGNIASLLVLFCRTLILCFYKDLLEIIN